MPAPRCPDPETLAAFVRGDLPADELAAVADHVVGCEACGHAMKFVPEDSLAGLARAAVASETVKAGGPSGVAPAAGGAADVPDGFADHPRYRIVGRLGAGGMGTVYKAEDLWMGRVIALKIVSPHLTARASAAERFRKEIRVAAQLNDPRMIIAHDTGEAGGCQFLVMEYVDGFSLDRLVAKKGPLAVHMACAFTRQAALGLQHAADKGMIHRDIKPQNLMVTRKGQIKILDFGLARFAHAEADEAAAHGPRLPFGAGKALTAAGITNPHMLMGTPDYLSPEQAKNSHDVDHRSDIYSLGCTLYFLLTGRPPFAAAETLVDKLLAHTHDAPPSPCDDRPDVPAGLDSILSRMMAKRPEERYQTAAEVAQALLPFTRSDATKEPVFEVVEAVVVPGARTASAAAFTLVPGSDTAPVAQERTLSDAPRPRRPRRRRKPWWKRRKGTVVVAALAAVFLLVGGVYGGAIRKKVSDWLPDAPATAKAPGAPAAEPQPKDEKPDRGEKGEKPDKAPDDKPGPSVPAVAVPAVVVPPAKAAQVLFVLPSDGVWLDDFLPVRDHLTSKGAKVVTASAAGGAAKPANGTPGAAVPVDVALRPDMDLSEYAAVLFCGERCDEYVAPGKGAFAAGKVMQRMFDAGKPVGGIGLGEAVLASHGALRGRRAAANRHMFERYPFVPWTKMNTIWEKPGVTVDGKIVTASGPREAVPFADAVLKLIDGK